MTSLQAAPAESSSAALQPVIKTASGAVRGTTAGRARPWVGTWRVVFWGALAMGLTAGIGKLFGVVAA